ncbi:MAG: hypothetical protein U9Q95_05380, partial [Candidatus Eisenbacteria bacterium]|nr:hypothetical protein [Candidatus Eisenbacteria bacterium]
LITMAAEQPPGCAEFVQDAIVAGLRDVSPRPQFIFWNWCSYPNQARQVIKSYDGEALVMSYLQYEHFFSRRADPRIGQYSADLGGVPMAALGGPKVGHAYLLFANPEFIHDVVADLFAHNNGRALLIEEVHAPDRWLAEAAFARYAWNPEEPYRDEVWEALIAERYGSRKLAAALLSAMKAASLVVPTQLKLTHSQSDHFMPQMGLTLAQILEMPTLSTYVFENTQQIDAKGYLTPHLGMSRPNPDWGERVLPIRQWVLGQIPDPGERRRELDQWLKSRRSMGYAPLQADGDEQTPAAVAAELERSAVEAKTALRQAEALWSSAERNEKDLTLMFDYVRLNISLGEYFAHKDKAAIAWERCRVLGEDEQAAACVAELQRSLTAWHEFAVLGDRLHPAGAWYWQNTCAFPPPWSQNDLWNNYVSRHTTFAELTPLWERELQLVRERLDKADRSNLALPLMDELRAPLPER